jgi:hypothetical protein
MRKSGRRYIQKAITKSNLTTSMPGIIDENQTLNLDKLK